MRRAVKAAGALADFNWQLGSDALIRGAGGELQGQAFGAFVGVPVSVLTFKVLLWRSKFERQ